MSWGRLDPQILAHLEWLGFVQPTGLVVSATALQRANELSIAATRGSGCALGAWIRARASVASGTAGHRGRAQAPPTSRLRAARPRLELGCPYFAGTSERPIPDELAVTLPQSSESLRPDFAVRDREPQPNRLAVATPRARVEPGQDVRLTSFARADLEASSMAASNACCA
jgi:hypothetical protein